jgi:hypothetical protein
MARLATVIDAVSQASMEIGITQKPISSAIGSQDQDIAQMLSLLSAVADEILLDEHYRRTLGDDQWLIDATGKEKPLPTANDDIILFDARLAIDGLKYRFLKAKGLEFGEEMRDFLTRLNKLAARANARVLDLETETGRVA